MTAVPEVLRHALAQALCYAEHGDWRYDPGKRSHRRYLEAADRFVSATELHTETMLMDDGVGGIPSSPRDRPPTVQVRFVGPWLRERSP